MAMSQNYQIKEVLPVLQKYFFKAKVVWVLEVQNNQDECL